MDTEVLSGDKRAVGAIIPCAKSFHGHKVSILSSFLQKSIRRRNVEDAQQIILEWSLFLDWKHPQSKGVNTNLYNRLCEVIIVEDILAFANPVSIMLIDYLGNKWLEEKTDDSTSAGRWLHYAVYLCCSGPLLRLPSDIRAQFSSIPPPNIEDIDHSSRIYGKKDDSLTMQYEIKLFIKLLLAEDPQCFGPLFRILTLDDDGEQGALRYKSRKCVWFLWEELLCISDATYTTVPFMQTFNKHMFTLFKKNPTRKERHYYLIQVVLSILHVKKLAFNEEELTSSFLKGKENAIDIVMNVEQWSFTIDEHKNGPALSIPDWAIDLHTDQGRSMGKNALDFAYEGSLVVDPDLRFFVQEWRDTYMAKKKHEVNKKKQKQEIPRKRKIDELSSPSPPTNSKLKTRTSITNIKKEDNLDFETKEKKQYILKLNQEAYIFTPIILKYTAINTKCVQMAADQGGILQEPCILAYRKDLDEFISSAPVAQRATQNSKPSVFIGINAVLKGPFICVIPKKGIQISRGFQLRWERIQSRISYFKDIGQNTPNMKLAIEEGSNNRYWIVQDRLGASDTDVNTAKASQSISMINGITARVIQKESIGHMRCSDVPKLELTPLICAKQWIALASRYISTISIGDSGLFNLVHANDEVFQVDFEEDRGNTDKKPENWQKCLAARHLNPDFVKACALYFPNIVVESKAKKTKKEKEATQKAESHPYLQELWIELGKGLTKTNHSNERRMWLEELANLDSNVQLNE